MNTRITLAAAGGGLFFFALGVIRSFWVAFIFPPPNPKFGGASSFYLGTLSSGFVAVCLALSLFATIPLYLRRVGPQRLRHLLIYCGTFALLTTFPASPAVSGLTSLLGKFFRVVGTNEIAGIILSVLASYMVAALAYCALISAATRFVQRRLHRASVIA